jgi:predicted double-glycine peptidase
MTPCGTMGSLFVLRSPTIIFIYAGIGLVFGVNAVSETTLRVAATEDAWASGSEAQKNLALKPPPMRFRDARAEEYSEVFDVPFYSQFNDISSPPWKKVGCGITSLAMVIAYYKQSDISVDTLLSQGVAKGAYLEGVGWTYRGLIEVAEERGFVGSSYDYAPLGAQQAFAKFEKDLESGPVITSVYYRFDPYSPVSHLIVVTGIDDDTVYYNDPAEASGGGTIAVKDFIRAWKKRYIVIRPAS